MRRARGPALPRRGPRAGPGDRRHRRLRGRRSRRAPRRGGAPGGHVDALLLGADRGHRRAHRGIRDEIRRQGAALAQRLGGDPHPGGQREPQRPLRRRRHRDRRTRDGGADARKAAAAVRLAALAGLVASALRPDGAWVATRYSIYAAAYNTGAVAAADVPRRYEDLRDPRWKGRLGIEADDANWFSAVVGALGEPAGLDLFRDIVARNGISIRKGHSLLANLVVSGEVPLALTAYGYRVDRLKKGGAPIDKVYLPPVIGLPTGVAVLAPGAASVRRGPVRRVHADRWPGHHGATRIRGDPAGSRRHPGGPAAHRSRGFLDQREKWTRLFKEIFVSQAH